MPDTPQRPADRPTRLRTIAWQHLFRPEVVAVVGATDTEGSPQAYQWRQARERLLALGARAVHPVHPTKDTIDGVPAYRTVSAVPDPVDTAVLLVREPLPVLRECLAAGVRFAIVFASGFAELGTEQGDRAQRQLARLADGPMRILGPNTNLNIYEPWREGLPGKKIAVISQSGNIGRPIVQAEALGVGVASWAPLGNEVDLEFADFVAEFAGRPEVGAIVAYVEGFKDGWTMRLAADSALRAGVPVIVIKVGRTEQGAAMARAHTGHLTGNDAVHDAVFRQAGVIRMEDIDEAIETAGAFCHSRPVTGRRVALCVMSGGTGSHVADLCGQYGLELPPLAPETSRRVRSLLPGYLHVDNPVDTGGVATSRPEGRAVLEALMDDPATDVLLAPINGVFPGLSDAITRDLVDLHRRGPKPVVVVWTSPIRDESHQALCAAGVPLFHSFRGAVVGIRAMADFTADRQPRRPLTTITPARRKVASTLARPGVRDERESGELLRAYGIPVLPSQVVTSADAAAAASAEVDGPVVLKALSRDLAHKSDLGLVITGVTGQDAARAAYDRIVATAAERAPTARLGGVVVAPQVTDAVAEVLLGVSHQHPFGPTITVGLGGVLAELVADTAFGVPPFDEDHARWMVGQTRIGALLAGFRGGPPGDLDALVATILRLRDLVLDVGHLVSEVDVNPLLVRPKGLGVVAVDALVVV